MFIYDDKCLPFHLRTYTFLKMYMDALVDEGQWGTTPEDRQRRPLFPHITAAKGQIDDFYKELSESGHRDLYERLTIITHVPPSCMCMHSAR